MNAASLQFDERSNMASRDVSLLTVQLADEENAARAEMESFVARAFLRCYSANVTSFMPWLLGVKRGEALWGVAGLRPAVAEGLSRPLFVEQYLDYPIEQVVAQYAACTVARSSIAEVGNLAGHRSGITRALFPLLTELLYENGYQWVVCNATSTVQNALARLGFTVIPLARAEPQRLGSARFSWGRYYDAETTVIAISVQDSHAALQSNPDVLLSYHDALSGCRNHFPVATEFLYQ
jgi:hypothetical protein